MHTKHSAIRAQQRGIPPFIDQMLDLHGHEEYDGKGIITAFFDKQSTRDMERDLGKPIVSRLKPWFRAYKIKSSTDGKTITTGHRTKRINRK